MKQTTSHIAFRDLGAVKTVAGTPGTLYGLHIENNQAAAAWIQVFDATAPTLGSTAPDFEMLVPANSSKDAVLPTWGLGFNTAITIASTTGEKGAVASAAGVQAFVFSR